MLRSFWVIRKPNINNGAMKQEGKLEEYSYNFPAAFIWCHKIFTGIACFTLFMYCSSAVV
jgi:hypothetical protein